MAPTVRIRNSVARRRSTAGTLTGSRRVNSDTNGENIAIVARFLDAFDRRWPDPRELDELLDEDVRFVERPNLVNPKGGERDRDTMRAGIDAGKALLAWQSYEVLEHIGDGDTVVTRFRWTGELGVDAGTWVAGTRLSAWCVAIYRLRAGRITHIEQLDCYDPPTAPAG